ncbi:MAG: hypothetical protein GY806_19075 [Gammaproteobacteria bacterium]|nr:hypothetical protein [Gammaproteobacteria bacterium]
MAVIISVALLSLYYATHVFRSILPVMVRHIKDNGSLLRKPIENYLSAKSLVFCGLSFAAINCFLAGKFGIPESQVVGQSAPFGYTVTLYWGYFLAGFVCGMAVQGIVTVCHAIGVYGSNAQAKLDYTSPDNCGGTLFLGNALMIFGSVTLLVGILISLYIIKTEWGVSNDFVTSLKIVWVIFPYLMSFVVFIVPVLTLNKSLTEYKSRQEYKLQTTLHRIRDSIDKGGEVDLDDLRKQYEFNQDMREKLHKMRTWPYGLDTNAKYLTVVIANTYAFYQSAESEISALANLAGLQ